MIATIFNIDTGEIHRCVTCHESIVRNQLLPGEWYTPGYSNDVTQYVDLDTGEITDKAQMPAVIDKTTLVADSVDAVNISGLPIPCLVQVEETVYQVDDGEFSTTVDLPGPYRIVCAAISYHEKVLEIEGQSPI